MQAHRFECRVYYEDTDLAGIVYHANYLKFIERARSTLVREAGVDQMALKRDLGLVFAVRDLRATYLRPARLDDVLEVRTVPGQASPARLTFAQDVFRGPERLFSAEVTVICLHDSGRPVRLPAEICRKLGL